MPIMVQLGLYLVFLSSLLGICLLVASALWR
jgi:hypothetical protein